MTLITLEATDQVLVAVEQPKISSGDINTVEIHVNFDSTWNGFVRSAVFFTVTDKTVYEVLLTDGTCVVPHEVMAKPGAMCIGVRGVNTDSYAVKTSSIVKYKIEEGAPSSAEAAAGPTPDVYQQILIELDNTQDRMGTMQRTIDDNFSILSGDIWSVSSNVSNLAGKIGRFKTVTGTTSSPVILRNLPSGTYNVVGYVKMCATQSNTQTGWQHLCHVTQLNGITYVQLLNPHVNALHNYIIQDDTYSIKTTYVSDLLSKLGGTMQGALYMRAGLYTYYTTHMYAPLNMHSYKIQNLATPTANTDAATKKYVDDKANGWLTAAIEEGLTT